MLNYTHGERAQLEQLGMLHTDLEAIVTSYFSSTIHRRKMAEEFGLSNHAGNLYIRSAANGSEETAVSALMNRLDVSSSALAADAEMSERIFLEKNIIPPVDALEKDVREVVRHALSQMGDTETLRRSNKLKAKSILMDLLPPELRRQPKESVGVREFEKRVDAIVNAHADFGGKRQTKDAVRHMQGVMNILDKKPVFGGANYENEMNMSRVARNFAATTLLSYTLLASLPDLMLPLLRSNFTAYKNGYLKKFENDPETLSAIRSIGINTAHLCMERMSDLNPRSGGKFSQWLFHVTGQQAWHKTNRETAALVGWEHFKLEIAAVRRGIENGATNTRQYKNSLRTLQRFGLEEFAQPGAPSIDNVKSLRDNDILRAAILKFDNDTQFQPDPNDIPFWAQTPAGAVAFQLKSFPLKMMRLTGDLIKEAHGGNPGPLIMLFTLGSAFGGAALSIRDVVQSRGGEENKDRATRNRSLSENNKIIFAMLDNLGIAPNEGDWSDDFLGWYIQSMLATGGLGLLAELLYNTGESLDNDAYGRERIASFIFGPTVGAGIDTLKVAAGIQQGIANVITDDEESAKIRSALRAVLARVPIAGGQKGLVEAGVDFFGGEAQQ
jgi:hypothetical protein